MRIIKQGILPDKILHEETCLYCKAVLEFERGEGKITYCQRDDDFVTVTCPTCTRPVISKI